MFSSRGEKIISLLRWPSLALVSALLGLFLYKSFTSERERIKKEVGLLFVNAVKGIEGDLFNQLLLDSIRPGIFFGQDEEMDSIHTIQFIGGHEQGTLLKKSDPTRHDSVKIVIRKNTEFTQKTIEKSLTTTKGVISIALRHHQDSNKSKASVFSYEFKTDSSLGKKIIKSFDDNLQKAGLTISYDFKQSRDSLPAWASTSATGIYTDIATGENFLINLKNENLSALRAIWLELVLSILLMACLILAFYSMSSTISKERSIMQARNEFIQNMTHELKTPISTVKLAIEGLHEYDGKDDASKRDEYIQISQSELDRLHLLVERVLSLSKLDKNLPASIKEPINLNELVHHIAATFKVQAMKQHAVINIHDYDPGISITADRQWLSGIIYNLLENAIKYADKEHTLIEVTIEQISGGIELSVKDNGPGIPEEHHSKIFDKFYRIPTGNIHTVKGHGLGLAFVKRLVQEMGGSISLASHMGSGTEFKIYLPV